MKWKGSSRLAVSGVDDLKIPQFTVLDYKTISTIETLATGNPDVANGRVGGGGGEGGGGGGGGGGRTHP